MPTDLAILPLRDTILFPHAILPLAVARESSVALVHDAVKERKVIGVVTQRDPAIDDPVESDLFRVGTLTHIHKMFKFPDGSLRLVVQGVQRFRLHQVHQYRPFLKASIELLTEVVPPEQEIEVKALAQSAQGLFQRVVELSPTLSDELQTLAANIQEPSRLADFIAASLPSLTTPQKQEMLETLDVRARLERLNKVLVKDLEVLEVGNKIQSQVKTELQKNQREYYLREQMKAIQKELGEGDDQQREFNELREKVEAAGMPEDIKKEAMRELDRLSKMSPAAAEYTVARTYLDWLVALPWNKRTESEIDIKKAKEVLDNDHYDLEKIKERILEYLAVRKMKPDIKGPDPLLRRALRAWARPRWAAPSPRRWAASSTASRLGGMRDEAEIRGHRRTYIGALPGQIIQGLRRAESKNPVFMLDEVDKLGADFRGDPSSALLEVLDPEQNNTFKDHYIDLPFDLSRGAVHLHGQHPRHRPPGPARPHGGHPPGRLHRGGEAPHRAPAPHPAPARQPRHDRGERRLRGGRAQEADPRVHARGGPAQPGARDRQHHPQGRAPARGRRARHRGRERGQGRGVPGRAHLHARGDGRAHAHPRRLHRPQLDGRRRRGALHRGHADVGPEGPHHHRPARRRHEGVGPGRAVLGARPRACSSASRSRSSSAWTCTCTCPRAPSPRTARPRA